MTVYDFCRTEVESNSMQKRLFDCFFIVHYLWLRTRLCHTATRLQMFSHETSRETTLETDIGRIFHRRYHATLEFRTRFASNEY